MENVLSSERTPSRSFPSIDEEIVGFEEDAESIIGMENVLSSERTPSPSFPSIDEEIFGFEEDAESIIGMENVLSSERTPFRSFPSIDELIFDFGEDAESIIGMENVLSSERTSFRSFPSIDKLKLDFEEDAESIFGMENVLSSERTPSPSCPSIDEDIFGFEEDAESIISMENVLSSERTPSRSFPSIDEEIVGFEEDAESIIQKLTGCTEELDVVSIVGMPGLGKTTLAKKVFTHPSVDKHFDVQAWCSISKEYNLRKMCSEILKQVLGSVDGIRNEDMPDKLRKSLMNKRYLIVLDDIWEVEAWEELQLSFPDDENGSRVVLTTRDEEVARQLKHHSDPYFLRFLTICPPELLNTGLRVAESCKGLPLVIVLIAGIIAKKREASLWLAIAKDLRSRVLEEKNMKILESSFDYLEDHLKFCLLYMGLFPEDYKFPVSNLLKFWIAENFVQNMGLENVEEASKICLNELVKKSLVIVSGRREDNGEIEYCTVHDVVHEFCMRKLAKEKFMQYQLAKEPQEENFMLYRLAEEPRSRRKYIHDDLVKHLLQYEKLLDKFPMLAGLKEWEFVDQCNARYSEFIDNPHSSLGDGIRLFSVLKNLRFIRVLHLLDVNLERCSWVTAVQVVTHLRYLAIRTQEFDFQWVSHLHDLQTLQVVGNDDKLSGCFETSPSIWKMQKLRHVDIQDFSFKWEDNDRALFEESSETVLPNLKTFGKCRIYLVDKTPEFWWRFPNIEQLNLHFIEPGYEVDMPNLEELPLLSLELCFSRAISGYKSIGRARCVVFPSNLKDLSLDRLCLTEKVVSQLARLRNLESLKLREVYFKSEDRYGQAGYSICWDVSDYEFRALKYLNLQNVLVTEWRSSEESFPVLEQLIINNCIIQCGQIPCSFVDIPTLKLIKLICCDESLKLSAFNIKNQVEEITGCDSLQVLNKYEYFNYGIRFRLENTIPEDIWYRRACQKSTSGRELMLLGFFKNVVIFMLPAKVNFEEPITIWKENMQDALKIESVSSIEMIKGKKFYILLLVKMN
uniref:RGA 0.1 n=1 Tax=Solanum demissum TaxID=50514 RepID=A0A191UMP3_SOLDE|nr:RGA 0.1 [Solanum demissum]